MPVVRSAECIWQAPGRVQSHNKSSEQTQSNYCLGLQPLARVEVCAVIPNSLIQLAGVVCQDRFCRNILCDLPLSLRLVFPAGFRRFSRTFGPLFFRHCSCASLSAFQSNHDFDKALADINQAIQHRMANETGIPFTINFDWKRRTDG